MRRNSAGRRGGLNVTGGPLITEHLKDLDLELELLKRKREMIEQQHLYSPYGSQSQYEPPSYNPHNFESNRDFSHMYSDGPSYGQHGRKRQCDPWEHDGAKMFPNKKKPIQSIFGSRLGPKPGPSGPSHAGPAPARYQRPQPSAGYSPKPFKSPSALMTVKTSVGQKFQRRPLLKTPQSSGKVSKPKPATAPNKIASKPVAERVNLVAEATKSSAAVDESLILREDCPPSRQMTGRLELTLGVLMKEIKDRYGNTPAHAALFNAQHTQRVMKQAIRERIRVVMLGKVVGSNTDIKRQYREEYPEETDIDILNIALGAVGLPPADKPEMTQIKSEDVEQILKNKMCDLMDVRLNEMFTKLKEIYAKERPDNTVGKPEQTEVAGEELEGNVKDEAGGEGTRRSAGFALVRRSLPRLLKKYTNTIINLMDVDEIYASAKEAVATDVKEMQVSAGDSQDDEPTPVQQLSLNALPYYVKIKAKPVLPKKKIMREFLAGFNTKTIKKHKSVHNLLFVGFTDKKDHDNMLAASGTVIGSSTLEISPSEKAVPKPSQEDINSLDISPELDGQITDLLTSIRRAEEEDMAKDDENGEKMDTCEDSQVKVEVTDENDSANTEEVMEQNDGADEDGSTEGIIVLEKIKVENHADDLQEHANTETTIKPAESEVTETLAEAEVPEQTAKILETAKVVATPVKIAATPAAVAPTPAKVVATPAKAAPTPAKVVATPAAVAPIPAKVAATPAEGAPTPAKVVATPAKAAPTPAKVVSTPAAVAPTPAKVAATPVKAAPTPASVAPTPAKVVATPAKAAPTPAKVVATPAKVAATPAAVAPKPPSVAATPAKIVATPAKAAPTPASVAATSAKAASTPAKVATTPAKAAPTPASVAATSAKAAPTPASVAATSAKAAPTPAKVAATPTKAAPTPASVAATPAKAAPTPAKVAATPASVTSTPAKVAATPASVAPTPAKVAATPASVAPTPAKVAATPAKVAETLAKAAENAPKASENSEKVAEPVKNDADTSKIDSEKRDTVAELKSEAKDTGRSTPTRVTRSANVTPSTIRTRRASRLAQSQ